MRYVFNDTIYRVFQNIRPDNGSISSKDYKAIFNALGHGAMMSHGSLPVFEWGRENILHRAFEEKMDVYISILDLTETE